MAELNTCLACAGPLIVLGQLGRRLHLRCRDCGLDQSEVLDDGPDFRTGNDEVEYADEEGND